METSIIKEINEDIDYFVKKCNLSKSVRECYIYLLFIKQLEEKKKALK